MLAKIFISWWMMGECTGYHVQKEWNFYLAVQARNKFFYCSDNRKMVIHGKVFLAIFGFLRVKKF